MSNDNETQETIEDADTSAVKQDDRSPEQIKNDTFAEKLRTDPDFDVLQVHDNFRETREVMDFRKAVNNARSDAELHSLYVKIKDYKASSDKIEKSLQKLKDRVESKIGERVKVLKLKKLVSKRRRR